MRIVIGDKAVRLRKHDVVPSALAKTIREKATVSQFAAHRFNAGYYVIEDDEREVWHTFSDDVAGRGPAGTPLTYDGSFRKQSNAQEYAVTAARF
jgi:hypothetical protein